MSRIRTKVKAMDAPLEMVRPRYRSIINYDHTREKREETVGNSLTMPDMAMSIQEMMARHMRNQDMSIFARNPLYDNSDDFDHEDTADMGGMDVVDIMERIDKQDVYQNMIKSKRPSDITEDKKEQRTELAKDESDVQIPKVEPDDLPLKNGL